MFRNLPKIWLQMTKLTKARLEMALVKMLKYFHKFHVKLIKNGPQKLLTSGIVNNRFMTTTRTIRKTLMMLDILRK